ncbi:MAG: hypothetical protein AABW82_03835 [Nanoarchaeota archaeon]
MDNYIGVIIEESLEDKTILKNLKITKKRVSQVTAKHKTPWVKTWTLDTIKINENQADKISKIISLSLDSNHDWYCDYKNSEYHYIIFRNKIFKINRTSKEQYDEAKVYGISLGIPPYQVNFHPDLEE